MDTLSTSASSFNVIPNRNPKSHGFHHFKNHHLPQPSHLISSTTRPRSPKLPNRASSPLRTSTHNNSTKLSLTSVNPSQSANLSFSNPETFHHKPATGYAVALLDTARCNNLLREISRDVKRLSRWLSNEQLRGVLVSPFVEKRVKGGIVKEIVSKGHFHKHLVRLVNLLAEKSKGEMINEVLVEFARVYDEMIGSSKTNTQVVLVSSEVKMEENQVLRMAKRVHEISGADKVKVRQLVDGRLQSFGV